MMADEEEGVVDNWEDADTEVSPILKILALIDRCVNNL